MQSVKIAAKEKICPNFEDYQEIRTTDQFVCDQLFGRATIQEQSAQELTEVGVESYVISRARSDGVKTIASPVVRSIYPLITPWLSTLIRVD